MQFTGFRSDEVLDGLHAVKRYVRDCISAVPFALSGTVLFDELRPTGHVSATPRLRWWRCQVFVKAGLGPGLYNLHERKISDLDGVHPVSILAQQPGIKVGLPHVIFFGAIVAVTIGGIVADSKPNNNSAAVTTTVSHNRCNRSNSL